MKNAALITAGCVFAAVSIVHGVRYSLSQEIIVGGTIVPVSWSLVLGLIALALAIWMFFAARD
jgi:hypothetical protein